MFLTVAMASGPPSGHLLLVALALGMVASNTVIAAVSAVGYLSAAHRYGIDATVAVVTGVFSLAIGALLVSGQRALLPTTLGP